MRVLLTLLVTLMAVGCALAEHVTPTPTQFGDATEIGRTFTYHPILRYVDEEAGIVCYVPRNGRAIFCLPLHETTLDR